MQLPSVPNRADDIASTVNDVGRDMRDFVSVFNKLIGPLQKSAVDKIRIFDPCEGEILSSVPPSTTRMS